MDDLKTISNIIFFVTMSVIAVLSYFQARKTLFSPIKTEVFKLQIQGFQEVLAFFNKHSSDDFVREFGFDEILNINSLKMQHSYAHLFFKDKVKPSEEILERLRSESYGAIVSEEYLQEITPGSELIEKPKSEEGDLDSALKLARWNDYKLGGVTFTRQYHTKMEELTKLAASPLLPKELTDLLYDFINIIHGNLLCIGEVITESAREMPLKYSTTDSIIKFRPDWIWNRFNRKKKNTNEVTETILRFVKEYLKINELMK